MDESRTVDGAGFDLTFNNILNFNVTTTTGGVDIVADTTDVDGNLTLQDYGADGIKGTVATILAVDTNGNVIETTADEILSNQVDSTIYWCSSFKSKSKPPSQYHANHDLIVPPLSISMVDTSNTPYPLSNNRIALILLASFLSFDRLYCSTKEARSEIVRKEACAFIYTNIHILLIYICI
ncbi:MAG: hypothetical protein ACJA01_002720 [Saprospiraceae bacterium]